MLKELRRYPFLHTFINALTMEETLQWVESVILERRLVQHVVINAGKVVLMRQNPQLLKIVNDCEMINADGQAVVWAARWLHIPVPERVAGVDLMLKLLDLAENRGYRVYILGAEAAVLEQAINNLRLTHPNLQIAGSHHGYFSDAEEDLVVNGIANNEADILFVAMSSPKKEIWLHRNMTRLRVPFCMGVGGSIDIVANITSRAPVWLQQLGFEWLYRLLQEPRRMWKRYSVSNTVFILLVCKALLRQCFNRIQNRSM